MTAHRSSPRRAATVRVDIDRAVAEVLDPPARQCRPHNLCEACRRDVREESLAWLRELADTARVGTELEYRAWELHSIGVRQIFIH
jgi:hypothetical protein